MEELIPLSVIVPFYKGNKYVQSLVKMVDKAAFVLKQKFPNTLVELIFINDSPEIVIDSFDAPLNIDVKVINHEKNQGIHKARVTGLDVCRGKYIHFLDQDDEIHSDFLKTQFEHINGFDVAVCNAINEISAEKSTILYKSPLHFKQITKKICYIKAHNLIISPGQCLIKKSSIPQKWTEHTTKINGADDLLLWLLMLSNGCKFALNFSALYTHKHTGENLSASEEKMQLSSFEVLDYLKSVGAVSAKEIKLFKKSRELNLKMLNPSKLKRAFAYITMPSITFSRTLWRAERFINRF